MAFSFLLKVGKVLDFLQSFGSEFQILAPCMQSCFAKISLLGALDLNWNYEPHSFNQIFPHFYICSEIRHHHSREAVICNNGSIVAKHNFGIFKYSSPSAQIANKNSCYTSSGRHTSYVTCAFLPIRLYRCLHILVSGHRSRRSLITKF